MGMVAWDPTYRIPFAERVYPQVPDDARTWATCQRLPYVPVSCPIRHQNATAKLRWRFSSIVSCTPSATITSRSTNVFSRIVLRVLLPSRRNRLAWHATYDGMRDGRCGMRRILMEQCFALAGSPS